MSIEIEQIEDFNYIASQIAMPKGSRLLVDDIIEKNPSELTDEEIQHLINFKASVMARNTRSDVRSEINTISSRLNAMRIEQDAHAYEANVEKTRAVLAEYKDTIKTKCDATKELVAAVKAKAKAAMEEVNGTDEQEDTQG